MKDRQTERLTPQEIKAVLDEVVRAELGRIIDGLDIEQPRTNEVVEKKIAKLESEISALKAAARLRDFAAVESRVVEAAERLAIALETPLQGPLARQAVAKMRALKEAEIDVEDGEDIAEAASSLIDDHLSGDISRARNEPLTLSRAIACSLEHARSSDMGNKYSATGRIAIEVLGDIGLHAVSKRDVEHLMRFIFRLPRNHGKTHGKNRFKKQGETLSKAEEVRLADEADRRQLDDMQARTDISDLEKRAQLKSLLVPRQTPANVQHHLNRLRGIFKAAAKHLGYDGECRFMSDAELGELIEDAKPRDKLTFHCTQPKTRECWSKERMQTLLRSPIYTGSFSRHRRWRPGTVIVRDSIYWVPLILMTIGSRVDEILRLNKSSVVLRDGVVCLGLNVVFADDGKTSSAQRYIPVPELILRLGFVDWVKSLPGGPLVPLFPEIAHESGIDRLSDTFSKRCGTLFQHLGIKDWNEDLYALRKTLSTALSKAGIDDSKRQAIAGHCGGSILNIHYTSHDPQDLKDVIDRVDLKVRIEWSDRHGHPVIADCGLLADDMVDVELELADDGSAAFMSVSDDSSDAPLLQIRISSAECSDSGFSTERGIDHSEAARRLSDALAGRKPRKMHSPAKQQALDYLLLLGHPTAREMDTRP